MCRPTWGGFVGIVAAGCLLLPAGDTVNLRGGEKQEKPAGAGHDHMGPYEICAKACTSCLRECESCMLHCVHMLAQGKKHHERTVGTCLDCAEICGTAARVTAHHGPLSEQICESCAKACDVCGEACRKFTGDAHMQRCAQACRDCAQACRDMLKHIGGPKAGP